MTFSQGHICQCLTKISLRDSPATIFGSRQKSGRQFADSVRSLAGGLSELGIRRGDVVALAALNSDWYLEWLLAIAFVGGIAAPLNYRWSFEEARWAMEVTGPKILVVDASCEMWLLNLQSNQIPSLKTIVFIGSSSLPTLNNIFNVLSQDEIRKPLDEGLPSFDYLCAPRGVALICFTSGTTGRPKGAAISHTALIVQSLAKVAIVGYGENDVYLHTAPLCHIGGISSAMAMLMVGGSHVFIPKFDAKEALQAIEKHLVTSLITLPTIMADLISLLSKKKTKGGGESVKKILNGGGGLSNELIKRATLIFPNAKLFSAYGMTEACSSLTFMTHWDPTIPNTSKLFPKNSNECDEKIHSRQGGICVGKPAPHVELLIKCEDRNNDPSRVGRILTRGQHVMVGYWGETPATMPVSGELRWLETGDLGYFDANGDLWLMGRAKDRIKSGGENVYPQEVERVISQHPGVLDITVFGVPHQRLMEMVTACIRLREGWRWADPEYSQNQDESKEGILSEKILQNYCKHRNLTGFKIPKVFILWRKPFPTTTTGKTRRDEMRKEAISHLQFMPSNL